MLESEWLEKLLLIAIEMRSFFFGYPKKRWSTNRLITVGKTGLRPSVSATCEHMLARTWHGEISV